MAFPTSVHAVIPHTFPAGHLFKARRAIFTLAALQSFNLPCHPARQLPRLAALLVRGTRAPALNDDHLHATQCLSFPNQAKTLTLATPLLTQTPTLKNTHTHARAPTRTHTQQTVAHVVHRGLSAIKNAAQGTGTTVCTVATTGL